jgi:hypothetical protein
VSVTPIPTEYNGVVYRSRTEARWAVFFTENDIPFSYEMEGFDLDGIRYLPDFWLPIGKLWIEVKPYEPLSQEIEKAKRLAKNLRNMVFIIPGGPAADVSLIAVSPTGKTQPEWKFAYAHEEGVGYLCDNVWGCKHQIKIADVKNPPGMYGMGPDDQLSAAAKHEFPWRRGGRFREGSGRCGEIPRGKIIGERSPPQRTITYGSNDMFGLRHRSGRRVGDK